MKKRITRLAAFILAVAVAMTASVLPVMANGTAAVEPEILFYRDFEDYTGGDPYNTVYTNRDYGTWGIYGDETYDGATAVEGDFGTAVKYPAGVNLNDGTTAFTPKTAGKLYFAFDFDTSANAETSTYPQVKFKESGASAQDIYVFTYNTKSKKYVGGNTQYSENASWQVNTATGVSANNKNRIELLFDIDNGKVYKYINGILGTVHDDTGRNNLNDLAHMSLNPRAGNIVDNLTVIHYPSNVAQQTYQVESADIIDDDTFSVFLNGTVTDSDAKGTDVKSPITASYPVTLDDSQLTADAFSIDGLTVTGVTRGEKVGEYKISVSEGIAEGVNYTITAKTGLEDITGAVVDENAKTAVVMKPIKVPEPEVMFYRDFEDYEGGDPYNQDANGKAYGTWEIIGGASYDGCIAVVGEDGLAVQIPAKESEPGQKINNSFDRNDGITAFNRKTNGKIYFAFDLDASINGAGGSNVWTQLVIRDSDAGKDADVYAITYNAKTNRYVGEGNQYGSNASWNDNVSTGVSPDYKNKFEIIIDIDEHKIYKYINGILGATYDDTGYDNLSDVASISFNPKGENIVDNLAVVHYPAGVGTQTFSIESIEADEKTDVFRVFLKSDTVDPDGKGTSTKSSIAAPYGITLTSTGASGSVYALDSDTFSVEGMNVTSVTKGKRSGEYIVEVDGDIETGKNYTVSAKSSLTDILGSIVNPDKGSKTVTVAPKLAATVAKSGTDAKVTFSDNITNPAEYSKGATVKNIYTGETGVATLTRINANSAVIGGYDFVLGDEYEITLPGTLRGKLGNSLRDNVVRFNLGATNSLKKLSLVDIQGNKKDLSDVNSVGLDNIEFEFTGDVTAANAVVTITGQQSGVFSDYQVQNTGNTKILKLNKILAPDETYTISITGLQKAYSITLKTKDAGLERLPVMFTDENGVKLESISAGDTVKVRMDFVNSTTEAKKFLASASMFAGLEMTNFAHKEITMQPASNGGTGTHTEIFTFTVSKTTGGVKLNGYMWATDGGKFAPIVTFANFE